MAGVTIAPVMRLLERDDELELLLRAADEAADGVGCLVLVGGEAGIGKTSLVRALRERLDERIAFFEPRGDHPSA